MSIRKIKLAGTVLTWSAYLVDEDEHGRWLFTPRGSVVHNCMGDEEWWATMGLGTEAGFLWLMPYDEWSFAAWWRRPERDQIGIDACTPPTLVDGIWTWTDLELDVCRDGTGSVWVEDEDEFDESIGAGFIDAEAEHEARSITAEMVRRLTDRVPPFDDTGWDRHDATVARNVAPLEPPS